MATISCPNCEMLSINGVACHEIGCPNSVARWDDDSEEWIKQRECRICGFWCDKDDPCCSAAHDDEDQE